MACCFERITPGFEDIHYLPLALFVSSPSIWRSGGYYHGQDDVSNGVQAMEYFPLLGIHPWFILGPSQMVLLKDHLKMASLRVLLQPFYFVGCSFGSRYFNDWCVLSE